MKFSILALFAAATANAAVLNARADPGCPAQMPSQVPQQLYLCCAYVITAETCCERESGYGYPACSSIGTLA